VSGWLYALVCVLAPAAWGLLTFAFFDWRQRRAPPADELPPIDYCI
jgi:hypothetical protein